MISNFFFFFKLKGCCSFRCIEIFSFFYLSICDGWVFSSWWWFQCNVLFFKEAFGRLVSTSQWLPFSEDVCIIVIFFYLPFCQYLVWKVAYCPLLSSFFPSSSFQICNVPISCLLVRTQSGLVFPIRGRVCVRAQASCLCFLTVLFHFTHNHIQSFCIDLTPKFCNTWVKVTALSLFFGQVIHFFFFF